MHIPQIHVGIGVKSFFKLEAFKPVLNAYGEPLLDRFGREIEKPGSRRELTGWFPNKLLDNGRNRMGTNSDWMNCCQVGTNNTAPLATDTGLLGYIAGTSSVQDNDVGAQASAPYFGWRQKRWRFPVGSTAANLSEVGIGWSTSAGAYLVVRALIVDGGGTPTTVTPQADEILDVINQFRYYPPLVDDTGVVNLAGTDYDYTIRAAEVNNSGAWGAGIGAEVKVAGSLTSDWKAYDGNLGTLVQSPSGTSANADSTGWWSDTYSNNSYQRTMNISIGPTGWNLGSGIRSMRIKTSAGWYQTQFDASSGGATIPKDSGYTMSMQWIVNWFEATIP